jgi:hypothetical protein
MLVENSASRDRETGGDDKTALNKEKLVPIPLRHPTPPCVVMTTVAQLG